MNITKILFYGDVSYGDLSYGDLSCGDLSSVKLSVICYNLVSSAYCMVGELVLSISLVYLRYFLKILKFRWKKILCYAKKMWSLDQLIYVVGSFGVLHLKELSISFHAYVMCYVIGYRI